MTEFASSAKFQVQVRTMPSVFACGATVQQEPPVEERDALDSYFRNPVGYAWRANFVEPDLEELHGLGPVLLPFDF